MAVLSQGIAQGLDRAGLGVTENLPSVSHTHLNRQDRITRIPVMHCVEH